MTDILSRARAISALAERELAAAAGPDHKLLVLSNRGDQALQFIPVMAEEIERLREVAKAVYSKWAGGEPVDKDMTELGRMLGFEVDVP